MKMEKNIYDLGLFESAQVTIQGIDVYWTVVRVPGGWIVQDGHSSTYIPHLEHLSMSLRPENGVRESTDTEQQKDKKDAEAFRPIVARLLEELSRFKALPPGKTYKSAQIAKLLFDILNPTL
jgi:hypothetical protein